MSHLDARWLSTAAAKPKGITVLGRHTANMACVKYNCFIETFTASLINVFKGLRAEPFSLSLIKSVVEEASCYMLMIFNVSISFVVASIIRSTSSSWLDLLSWYQDSVKSTQYSVRFLFLWWNNFKCKRHLK